MTDGPSLDLSVEVETASGRRYSWNPDQLEADDLPSGLDFRSQSGEGFADGGVTLTRRIDQDYPDLDLLSTVRFIGADGTVAYESRHIRNPRSISDGHAISLDLGGWMSNAKDRTFSEIYVDRDVSHWGPPTLDQRVANAIDSKPLDVHIQASADKASLHFEGTTDSVIPNGSRALLMYVMPEVCRAAAFQYRLRQDFAGNYTAPTLYATDNDSVLFGSQDAYTLTASTSVQSQALTTARRYLMLMLNRSPAGTPTSPAKRHYTTPAVYGNHGLTLRDNGGEPSGLYASDVITDILSRFCPRLSADGIQATDYPISHIAWPESITPYDAIQEMAAYHGWNLGAWEDGVVSFAPADLSKADWQVRFDDPGVTLDLQGDSIETLRNGIVVEYEDVKEGPRTLYPTDYEELRDETETNPANRHGIELWGEPLRVPFPCAETDALRLGTIALADSIIPKASGGVRITGHVADSRGNLRPGWMVRAGQTIAVTNFPNDRPRLISETSWDHDSRTLTVNVELPSYGLDALYARVANRRTARGIG